MARGISSTPLRTWSAVGLTGLVALAAVTDGLVGAGSFVGGPWILLLAAVAGCLLGAWTTYRVAATGVLVAAAALTFGSQRHFADEYPAADDLAFFLIVVGGPALLGATLVARVAQVRELDALSEQLAVQRADAVAAARLGEQQRIELAVHHRLVERMGAIALRAEGAREEQATCTGDVLAEIEQTARTGLDELRHALGVLREEPATPIVDGTGATDGAPPTDGARRPRTAEAPPGGADVLLVAALGTAMAVESVASSASRGPEWANVLLALGVAAPLVVRRQHPLLALVAVLALGTAYSSVLTPLPAMVTSIVLLLVGAYAVGAYARGWWRAAGVVLMWLGLLLLGLVSPPEARDPDGIVPTMVWSALAVGAGMFTASWTDRAEQLRAVVAELERLKDADVRLAVAQQRQRIARDLHDTVAHALSVVCLNAGAARQHGDLTTDALATIAQVSRAGMTELRRGLHSLEPAEGLHAPSLRVMAQRLGIDLRLTVPGEAEVDAADTALLLRVLRESLVNVARHAPGARVDATVTVDDGAVRIVVVDSGPVAAQPVAPGHGAGAELGAGVGLEGLDALVRERGGVLEFGPLPEGGFRVAAPLPVLEHAAGGAPRVPGPPQAFVRPARAAR